MTLALARVDQKLIHGQIAVAWVPYLGVDVIIVADEALAGDDWAQTAMKLGLPPEITEVIFLVPGQLPRAVSEHEPQKILILFKDLKAVTASLAAGFRLKRLNLGNQFYQPERGVVRLTETFYINLEDRRTLLDLHAQGVTISAQAVPRSKAVAWEALGLRCGCRSDCG